MTGQSCAGCVHRKSRMRGTEPRSWCGKFKTVTNTRCIDYLFKPKAVDLALRFFKRMAGKGSR